MCGYGKNLTHLQTLLLFKDSRRVTTADRRIIVANYLATNRKPKSVANFLFAGLRFRAALVAVLRGRRNFPRGNFGFQGRNVRVDSYSA